MPPATRLVRVTPHHGLRPPGSKQRTSSNRRLRRCHGSDLLDKMEHKAPKLPLPYYYAVQSHPSYQCIISTMSPENIYDCSMDRVPPACEDV